MYFGFTEYWLNTVNFCSNGRIKLLATGAKLRVNNKKVPITNVLMARRGRHFITTMEQINNNKTKDNGINMMPIIFLVKNKNSDMSALYYPKMFTIPNSI